MVIQSIVNNKDIWEPEVVGCTQVLNRMYIFDYINYIWMKSSSFRIILKENIWFHVASHLLGASPAKRSVGPVVSCCYHLQTRKSFSICSHVLHNASTSVPSFMIHAPNARGWHDFAYLLAFSPGCSLRKDPHAVFRDWRRRERRHHLSDVWEGASDQKRWRLLNSTCHCLAAFSHGSKAFVGLVL